MKSYLNGKIIVKTGDITREAVDVIVNAANSSLMGGGGVDGAIHRAGGPAILDECKEIRSKHYPKGLPTGEAVITTAGDMPAEAVIHTVGPVYSQAGNDADRLLADAYRNSIRLAAENGYHTMAFPAISTGVYGFPKDRAAKVVSGVLMEWAESESEVETVYLVFFSERDVKIFIDHCTIPV